ncbi:hypothetical protein WMY93_022277 [Mugilogobius chulae]|uniref:Uncharacterized protein n=1 Tax=Mugilogobius chulae TaxID=88201 RepID=A0AAW0NH39_9GOBI
MRYSDARGVGTATQLQIFANRADRIPTRLGSIAHEIIFHNHIRLKVDQAGLDIDSTLQTHKSTSKDNHRFCNSMLFTMLSSSWRRSPNSSRNGSCEDLLSDSASVASDVSDSSMNSSCLGKRTLAPPTKTIRTRSGVKPPDRSRLRNTSSSSSSVSSLNSSISLSPANKGKLNKSFSEEHLQTGASTETPSFCGRSALGPAFLCAGRRSLSVQTQKPSNVAALRKPESPLMTPVKRGLERTTSVPSVSRIQSGLKTKLKPQALVPPTPNSTQHGSSSPDATKILKPKRLISVKSVDSLPQKLSALTPSGGSSSSLQFKPRRPSALPTPVRSRLSGLPQATPTSQSDQSECCQPKTAPPQGKTHKSTREKTTDVLPRNGKRLLLFEIHHILQSRQLNSTEVEESPELPMIQPFNLEEEEPAQVPPTISESDHSESTTASDQPDQSESTTAPDVVCLSKSETTEEPNQKPKTETSVKHKRFSFWTCRLLLFSLRRSFSLI